MDSDVESVESDIEVDIIPETVEAPIAITKEVVVVKPENRRTSSVMTAFEMAECNSFRGTDIARNNNCLVDTTGLTDYMDMAKRELMMRMCPLTLRRFVGERIRDGIVEEVYEWWSPNEMTFAVTYPV